ncbi:dipeptidyl peptidase IV N-terminal region-domain-containing protein [Kalaharituber pfeilii]|nr:dipeptidyl peptidase IV N-terminal region-domain-containing protein [Kalaharituber pfeilii]
MKLTLFPAIFLLFTTTTLAVPAPAPPPQTGKKLISFTDAFTTQLAPKRSSYVWVDGDTPDEDGLYIVTDSASNSLVFSNVATNESRVFLKLDEVKDTEGKVLDYWDFEIQASRKHVLFSANYTKGYRYSFKADYYVHDLTTSTTAPLIPDQAGDIQYAGFSPSGDRIAFVRGNDLYIWSSGNVTRITQDGSPDIFNAVPDWVYEEEIYSDTKTLWWAPDGSYVAFLKMNETGVPTYTVPYYMGREGQTIAPPYPDNLDIRYPKVGETNPTVTFNLLRLRDEVAKFEVEELKFEAFEPEDLLITEVAWVTDDHSHVIFRTMNRVQDLEKLVLVDVKNGARTKVVRDRDGKDGWIDNNLAITYIPGSNPPSYLDLSDHSGYQHIYLYSRDGSVEPKALTSGKWEVTSVRKIDTKRGIVYYISTERDSTERHLYSVSLTNPGKNKKALVDVKNPGYWGASFSTGGGYYLLSYNGPNIPYQKLYSVSSDGEKHTLVRTVQDNAALTETLSEYALPQLRWSTLKHPDGYMLNVLERLPAKFDSRKKYPVLFDIYGGPGSQETGKQFRTPDWDTYVGSDPELSYIVLTVDNRGTGFKGRAFRALVAGHLGEFEAADQIWAAKQWAKKPYVDANHIVIWGWSYGGYLSSKVIEANVGSNEVFTRAFITAPVSDWRFYDSMYTERYMKLVSSTPQDLERYLNSSVSRVEGFKLVKGGVLVQHGTGDDNVHFQHSAVLTETLMKGGVGPDKLRVGWFTDSDHSIRRQGQNGFLFKMLTEELWEEKGRVEEKEGEREHQWEEEEEEKDKKVRND